MYLRDDGLRTSGGSSLTLRDRKKVKLRQTAIEVATRLFESQGYEETTLEQVCERAEISLRTLLRYFPTKEDLALAREIAALETFAQALAELDEGGSGILFWRDFIVSASKRVDIKYMLLRYRLIHSTPALHMKLLTIYLSYEDLLADRFAQEAGVDPKSDLYGQMLAGLLVASVRRVNSQWNESLGRADLPKLIGDVVDLAMKHFPPRSRQDRGAGGQAKAAKRVARR